MRKHYFVTLCVPYQWRPFPQILF